MKKVIKINTLQEAKGILPDLAIIHVGLALKQGHTVIVEDKDVDYVFEPRNEDVG